MTTPRCDVPGCYGDSYCLWDGAHICARCLREIDHRLRQRPQSHSQFLARDGVVLELGHARATQPTKTNVAAIDKTATAKANQSSLVDSFIMESVPATSAAVPQIPSAPLAPRRPFNVARVLWFAGFISAIRELLRDPVDGPVWLHVVGGLSCAIVAASHVWRDLRGMRGEE